MRWHIECSSSHETVCVVCVDQITLKYHKKADADIKLIGFHYLLSDFVFYYYNSFA